MSLKYNGKQTLAAAIVLLVIGTFAVVFGIVQKVNFENIKRWPVAKAEVTKVFEHYYDNDNDPMHKGNAYYIESYTVHLSFAIDGKSYSRAFTIPKNMYSNENAMSVLYNPKNPVEAYLKSDPPESKDYYYYGAIFIVLGLLVFFSAFEKNKPKKN